MCRQSNGFSLNPRSLADYLQSLSGNKVANEQISVTAFSWRSSYPFLALSSCMIPGHCLLRALLSFGACEEATEVMDH